MRITASAMALALAIAAPGLAAEKGSEATGAGAAESTAASAPVRASTASPRGYVHVVQPGDTLWDISEAYLGTPWVWPSIWKDNPKVKNPHRIYPGDRIWISPTEMRRVTAEEAERLLAETPPPAPKPQPPAAMPASEATEAPPAPVPPQRLRVAGLGGIGLVSTETLEAASSIVDSPAPYPWLGEGDVVYLGLGEGETAVGRRYEVVRPGEKVRDPESGRVIGVHIERLGWVEVTELHPQSCVAVVRRSYNEMRRGDLVLPWSARSEELVLQPPPKGVEGRVAFLPAHRTEMGSLDVVFLNRGREAGLAAGQPLEIFRPSGHGRDPVRGKTVELPDRVIGKLVVVEAEPQAAVAVVTEARAPIEIGDRFRAPVR